MDAVTVGTLGMIGMLIAVFSGVRIIYATALVGFLGLMHMRGWNVAIGISGFIPHAETSHYSFSVLPLYILIGHLAYHAGITQSAFYAARQWFGWLPGGLAIATVFAAGGFSAVSGASTACAAVFARVAIPEMLRYGYNRSLAAASVAAGGTLDALIPPSALLVIYGLLVEESIGDLLLAGFIPGAVSALGYVLVVLYQVWWNPSLGARATDTNWSERIRSLPGTIPIVGVITIILLGVYTGWMTPTETGAGGAMIVFVYALLRNSLKFKELTHALLDTAKTTAMIFSIVWGILIFVRFLGYAGLPAAFAEWLANLPVDRVIILIVILAFYVILGMFMDGIGMLLLTLPVVHPALIGLGYDSVWLGIIVTKMIGIGLLTPPVGLNCFVVAGVRPDIPLQTVFRGVLPFVISDMTVVALFIIWPEIVLYLPHSLRG